MDYLISVISTKLPNDRLIETKIRNGICGGMNKRITQCMVTE